MQRTRLTSNAAAQQYLKSLPEGKWTVARSVESAASNCVRACETFKLDGRPVLAIESDGLSAKVYRIDE